MLRNCLIFVFLPKLNIGPLNININLENQSILAFTRCVFFDLWQVTNTGYPFSEALILGLITKLPKLDIRSHLEISTQHTSYTCWLPSGEQILAEEGQFMLLSFFPFLNSPYILPSYIEIKYLNHVVKYCTLW